MPTAAMQELRKKAWARIAAFHDAWNAGDVEAALSHYTDDVEYSTAMHPGGPMRGKAELRPFFTQYMSVGGMKFTLVELLTGTDGIAYIVRREDGLLAVGVVEFDDASGKMKRVRAYHTTRRTRTDVDA